MCVTAGREVWSPVHPADADVRTSAQLTSGRAAFNLDLKGRGRHSKQNANPALATTSCAIEPVALKRGAGSSILASTVRLFSGVRGGTGKPSRSNISPRAPMNSVAGKKVGVRHAIGARCSGNARRSVPDARDDVEESISDDLDCSVLPCNNL